MLAEVLFSFIGFINTFLPCYFKYMHIKNYQASEEKS